MNPHPHAREDLAQAAASRGALTVSGLDKSFDIGGKPRKILDGINLNVRPGEFVSIVGASGCGKSTLLRLIAGLDTDYSGELRLDGDRIATTSLDRGIVFQDHRLFPWMTLEQNVELALLNTDTPKSRRAQIVADHIALVNLKGFEKAYPHQLSGGMAQRAAIARALVTEPKLLLLDEPLGALDALTRVHVQNELQRIWMAQRSTMVMVTHDVEEALYLGDRVIVMSPNPGRIRRIVEVDLPHPRDRRAPLLHRLKDEILAELTSGADAAESADNLVHLPSREAR
ncbi:MULTISPECIES: ABC transporter ATP-binding protein [Sphingobium]|uniref:Sulfonate ABC transporter ATP-binding protein n=2 Tax=Sphingobium fuliginis (strain ATCC 27551) TaxID=336203 RepID=A0ABQ1EZJ8_SPHSA|nr:MULTISPECIES: ABC transporter ATP-binding protein [Sphingobium]AJR25011.1 sulfonate ABC transporter ATP-binding protein [Sphingobium sp. YBL2]PNP99462.1 sulfonate ABC transporter ATP-binding protein [Sphingobium sp. SA916]QDC36342.1 ABC transporter ATP-binding protein [Sphingobium fuliginis ATCC 27551]RYL97674.1 ABC transporter ATP-binding protein [Sphingobium fuliginis]WDA37218.1 ABC transporter ATP-binding protein [Sphingobium sp. YC-XJ3]